MTTKYSELEENNELTAQEQEFKKMFPIVTCAICSALVVITFAIIFLVVPIVYNAIVSNYIENHDSVYYSYISTQPHAHDIKDNTRDMGYVIVCIVPIMTAVMIITVCLVIGTFPEHCHDNYNIPVKNIKIAYSILFPIFIVSLIGAVLLDVFYFKFELVDNVWIFSVENIVANIFSTLGIAIAFFIGNIIIVFILLLILWFFWGCVEWVKLVIKSRKVTKNDVCVENV